MRVATKVRISIGLMVTMGEMGLVPTVCNSVSVRSTTLFYATPPK